LTPKKAKLFIEEVVQELGISEKLVNDVINHYWKTVRKNMTELNHESLMIPALGKFNVKYWKIDQVIIENKAAIKKLENRFKGRFTVYNQQKTLEQVVEKLEKIKEGVEKRKEKFKQIKEKRNVKSIENNMEKQEPDTSRLPEQDL